MFLVVNREEKKSWEYNVKLQGQAYIHHGLLNDQKSIRYCPESSTKQARVRVTPEIHTIYSRIIIHETGRNLSRFLLKIGQMREWRAWVVDDSDNTKVRIRQGAGRTLVNFGHNLYRYFRTGLLVIGNSQHKYENSKGLSFEYAYERTKVRFSNSSNVDRYWFSNRGHCWSKRSVWH